MLDAPVDAWYVWVGLAMVAATTVGATTGFPTAPPPDSRAAAGTVDRVAAADYDATGRHRVDADAVKLEPGGLSLRHDGRTTHARFARPVTPVERETALWWLLLGARPADTFDEPSELRAAAGAARNRPVRWQRTDQLFVRTVTWGEVRVTLVGA